MKTVALYCIAALTIAWPVSGIAQAGAVGVPGRYVIVHSPHKQSDTVLLDTVTGKTWLQVEDASREGTPIYWANMAREDNAAEMAKWARDNPPKK